MNFELAESVKKDFGYEKIETDFDTMLQDDEINVIDIVTPPFLHIPMAIKALKAGKNVICEKPLTGYFGKKGEENIGATPPRSLMYEKVLNEMNELRDVLNETDKKFLYAENFIYATPVQKAAEIIRAKKSKILFMKGEESLKGSSSALAGKWNKTGGGTLIRTGTHPLSGMLWLKKQEAIARGEDIKIASVSADTGMTTKNLNEYEHRHIAARPEDVYISEMLPSKLGWNKAFVSDEVIRGYAGELKDFLETIALDKTPVSDFDIAYKTIQVIYAAYLSSEEGRRVNLD